MSDSRKHDFYSRSWFRSKRLFQNGMLWYFNTREGTVEGPFVDEYMAGDRLASYVRVMGLSFAPTAKFELQPIAIYR